MTLGNTALEIKLAMNVYQNEYKTYNNTLIWTTSY